MLSFGIREFQPLSQHSSGEISAHFKTSASEREAKGAIRVEGRQINATTLYGIVEEQVKIDYEALDRLIDAVTRDFSRKSMNSRLKVLARKTRNAATI